MNNLLIKCYAVCLEIMKKDGFKIFALQLKMLKKTYSKILLFRFSTHRSIILSLVDNPWKILWRNWSWTDTISDPSLLGGSVQS